MGIGVFFSPQEWQEGSVGSSRLSTRQRQLHQHRGGLSTVRELGGDPLIQTRRRVSLRGGFDFAVC